MDEKGLGARLQAVRREKRLTQQELCQRASLSYSTLAKIERGAIKSPSIFTIQRIATVLGVTLDELLGDVTSTVTTKRHTQSGVGFIYFDINGCLVRGYQRAFTALAQATGVLPDIIETFFWRYNDQANKGEVTLADFNKELSARLDQPVDWAEAYLAAVEPIAEMQDFLSRVSGEYRVGLFSNSMPGLVRALLDRKLLPTLAYDAIVDSSEIGVIKPEPKAYEIAQERAGCAAAEILLVDDTRGNIVAAQEAGWHVLLYDGASAEDSLQRLTTTLEL